MRDIQWLSDMRLVRWCILSCVVLACVSCYLPAVPLFTDTLLLPKWYLCALASALLLIACTVARLRHIEVSACRLTATFGHVYLRVTWVECLYVLMLVCIEGVPAAGVAGTFDNPAGLALSLCVAIPLSVRLLEHSKGNKWRKAYGWVCGIAVVGVLGLTKSRTGLLFLAICGSIFLCRIAETRLSAAHGRHWFRTLTVMLALGFCAVLLLVKKDSTSGRVFILERSVALAMESPFTGHGHGGFEREYMLRQADFFLRNPDSEYAMLADEVRHPLNEFLYLWVNYGVGAAFALMLLMATPYLLYFRFGFLRMKAVLLPLLSIILFSCFSYPFHYPVAWLVLASVLSLLWHWKRPCWLYVTPLVGCFLIGYMAMDAIAEYRWNKAYRHTFGPNRTAAMAEYESLHDDMHRNPLFLYNYAMTAYRLRHFQQAYTLAEECSLYWNGYNRELLAGDICRNLQQYGEAVRHYRMAKAMCPVRYAPLEGLYRTFDASDNDEEKENVAEEILNSKVKVNTPTIERIRKTCK